ncbi:MAG: polymerase sigma24 factor [Bacilli bacterium]|nr:polymerase sigma24 factor [Bacilli bacterium]
MELPTTEIFRDLFYTHYPSVRRKLVSLVRDESAAEDLAQEVFLRLYRNPPDELNAVGAWLHRVLTRIGYDYLNKKIREQALLKKQESFKGSTERVSISNEQVLMEQLDREEMHQWLNELSERDRQVLMLRYSGYSYEEIAEQMEIRQPLIGTLVNRATARLKRQADLHGQDLLRGNIQ